MLQRLYGHIGGTSYIGSHFFLKSKIAPFGTKGDVRYLSTFVRPAEEIKTVGVDYYNTYGQKMRNYSTYNGIISENGLRIENGMNVTKGDVHYLSAFVLLSREEKILQHL